MLTGLLLISRYRQGKVYPHILPLNDYYIPIAQNLIQVFQNSTQLKRIEIEDKLKRFHADKINPKVIQGLSKLLFDRSEFQTPAKIKPDETRAEIFEVSRKYWQSQNPVPTDFRNHQKEILKLLPKQIVPPKDDIDAWLYADIGANQKLTDFNPIKAEQLIHRYNLSQVQGLLINTKALKLKIETIDKPSMRKILQHLRFFGLLFSIESTEIFTEITISGPSSVLEQSKSYGLELANFLPAIFLLKCPWQLSADVYSKQRKRFFTLMFDHKSPYQTHLKSSDFWVNEKVSDLILKINEKKKSPYKASKSDKIITLSENRFLLPDFKIENKKEKSKYYIEWIRFQTKWKLEWLKKVHSEIPSNYIFAIKGKRIKLKQLSEMYNHQLLIYSNTFTAPAVLKQIEKN
ncbi:MAG: DUF790 family protein [Deltaproteobacteria bacterium]|jgi:uncharacterized protein|nr:DUF790 family protein [Deltaproteobacteria bacterium]MBT4525974.1 DUF790 family protein [Deltaproteobacteria bacterium]